MELEVAHPGDRTFKPLADSWFTRWSRILFKLRAICGSKFSEWTPEQPCIPGAVTGSSLGGNLAQLPLKALIRLVAGSLWSVVRAFMYSLFHTQPRS